MEDKEITKKYINDLVYKVIGASIEVHKELGPGLLESVYHKCLMKELDLQGIKYETEKSVPLIYKGLYLNTDLRCDLFVENILPVELKAVVQMIPIYDAQIISYINLFKVPKELIINFNVRNIYKEGQKTFVNKLYRELKD